MVALLDAILATLSYAIGIYTWIVIGAIIFSWLFAFNVINGRNQFISLLGEFFHATTEPVLRPIRQRMPSLGAIDISPIVLFVVLFFAQQLIFNIRLGLR